jgi:exopolyphosphatase/pppGpp-phosphohydrolase
MENRVDEYKYIATHVFRVAVNQKEIKDLIKVNTDIDINVTKAVVEARLTLWAVLMDFLEQKTCLYQCWVWKY